MGRFGQICIIQTKKSSNCSKLRKLPLKPVILSKETVDPKKLILTLDVDVDGGRAGLLMERRGRRWRALNCNCQVDVSAKET